MSVPRALLALLLGVIGGSSFVRADDEPALRQGVLPNGVRYLVLPHTAPRGGISLQLAVASGSVDQVTPAPASEGGFFRVTGSGARKS